MTGKIYKNIEILYEDAALIVCVKPAGTACETRNLRRQDMASLLRNYRSSRGEEAYVGLVHRLDQPVEGILVFGKDTKSTADLCRQLRQRSFSKVYLAVTLGLMPAQEGKLTDYLSRDSRLNTSHVSSAYDPQAKKAELLYHVLRTETKQKLVQNLVKIQLLTGRHHQIRVQMANMGTPIAGDLKYGAAFEENRQHDSILKLCACELRFVHPVTKKNMRFQIEPSWQY